MHGYINNVTIGDYYRISYNIETNEYDALIREQD